MNGPNISWFLAISFSLLRSVSGQGFINLDFESAQIVENQGLAVFVANAFPGWTVTAPYIAYDTFSLSGASISIMDDANVYPPNLIQGNYFVFLASDNYPGTDVPISLGQIGTIPLGTQSITFWGNIGGLQITFAGQSLAFSEDGSTANYNIYGANISQFAGDTGQLLFSLPPYVSSATLDNIQFSSSPVPEPRAMSLLSFCFFLLCWNMKRPNNSPEPPPIDAVSPHSRLTDWAARLSF